MMRNRYTAPFLIFLFVFTTLPVHADEANPEAYYKRSYRPDIVYLIMSRSTGLPYHLPAQPEPTTPEKIDPAPQPEHTFEARLNSRFHNHSAPKTTLSPVKTFNRHIRSKLQKFDFLIERYSQMNEIDPNLTRAMIYVESAGDPLAVSHKGARGLMQLMPATASDMGVSNPLDPAQNIFGGTRYIRSLVKRFGSVDLALWAYNAGPELVKRKKLPPETRRYIPEVIRIKKILDRGGT
ncbi:MAG: lytic transglycosylase domain-containing protein [bacterium]|nr:lytic transglycosylase domain-containing protein [bacterium]